jgi:hypothetical protein
MRWVLPVGAVLFAVASAPAQTPVLGHKDVNALAGTLRGLVVAHAPTTLYEDAPSWGETKRVANGVEWKGKIGLKPELQYKQKNHGVWKRMKVTAPNLADSLVLDIRHVRRPEEGRLLFDVFVSFDARVQYDQERWRSGIKTYDVSTRARLRVRVLLHCEVTTRIEPNGTFFPDAFMRLRVVKADAGYDNLVVEHIAGLGGDAAEVIGDTIHGAIKEFKPSAERKLFERANAAIVKAGDTKEVKLSLTGMFASKDFLTGQALELLKKK